jgi:DNA-binding NarL/FixJ family response regulator
MPNDLEALAVFASSARGYCNTHAGDEVLSKVAGVVSQGGLWIGESIMKRLLSAPMPKEALTTNTMWASSLTEREFEVAKAVALGASNKEIATQLGITERTIKAHVGAVLEKLQVRDRLQLALLVKDS